MSRIENYDVEIGENRGRYSIRMQPRPSVEFASIRGGGAYYVVDADRFIVLEKRFMK
jgi:hypothetical protein